VTFCLGVGVEIVETGSSPTSVYVVFKPLYSAGSFSSTVALSSNLSRVLDASEILSVPATEVSWAKLESVVVYDLFELRDDTNQNVTRSVHFL